MNLASCRSLLTCCQTRSNSVSQIVKSLSTWKCSKSRKLIRPVVSNVLTIKLHSATLSFNWRSRTLAAASPQIRLKTYLSILASLKTRSKPTPRDEVWASPFASWLLSRWAAEYLLNLKWARARPSQLNSQWCAKSLCTKAIFTNKRRPSSSRANPRTDLSSSRAATAGKILIGQTACSLMTHLSCWWRTKSS